MSHYGDSVVLARREFEFSEFIRSNISVLLLLIVMASSHNVRCCRGQEALRFSLAGEAAAETRAKAAVPPGLSAFRLGPSSWSFISELDLEANDNIRFASHDSSFDLITRPQVIARGSWPISADNALNLSLGAGYSAYTLHSEFNRLFIAPGSGLSLDLYVGDLWFNFHERFSLSENAYEDPTVIGSGDYSQLQNTVGVSGTWDLNKMVLALGYDHADYLIVSGDGLPDGHSDSFQISGTYRWKPGVLFGVEAGGGWLGYEAAGASLEQSTDWNSGVFFDTQLLEYVSLSFRAGYTRYSPQSPPGLAAGADFSGVYARAALQHRLNRFLDYNLSAGRTVNFGLFAGTIDLYAVLFEARWHLFPKLQVLTGFEFEHGTQLLSSRESFDRFGPRLALERSITRKISGALRYQHYQRCSNMTTGGYELNIVTLSAVLQL